MKTEWEKTLERRTKNIGFMTRLGAFREPTPAEKAAALAREIDSWQETKGKKTFTTTDEYTKPLGHGFNLKISFDDTEQSFQKAVSTYLETPMDKGGVLASQGIDVIPYENPPSFFKKIKNAIKAIDEYFRLLK